MANIKLTWGELFDVVYLATKAAPEWANHPEQMDAISKVRAILDTYEENDFILTPVDPE